jgi:CRP/FNR family transcriptional regulator, nitrogen oxide reductase regulator
VSTRDIDLSILANTELFSGLPRESLDDIRSRSFGKRFAAGETVFRQDGPASNLFVVVVGQLRVAQTTADGQQVIIRYIGPGDLVGYSILSGRERYANTAAAVDDTYVMGWSASSVRHLMEAYPDIALNALGIIGARYQELQDRLRQHATENVERRIAHAVLRLAKQAGRRTPQGLEIAFPVTRQDLAEMAGTTLHTVSRTMSAWEERNVVHSQRRRVVVKQQNVLAEIATGSS